jgi:membrane-associated protein
VDTLIDIFLNVDQHLADLAQAYGPWIYALLFGIVFAETGLVVTPFLPGDSLLFATGALSAIHILDVRLVSGLLFAAAVLGDAVNYAAGRRLGPIIFHAEARDTLWHRLINRDHLQQAHAFFERHGAMAIIIGRFVPIVRTFVPFVAGAGTMTYARFAVANVAGAALWVGICVGAGYLFGQVPVVKDNFSLVVIGIVAVSMIPLAVGFLRNWRRT